MPIPAIHPTGYALGALVSGLDAARPLDPTSSRTIHAAFLEHCVLLFRGQQLSKADLVNFSRNFGEPVPHPTNTRDRDPDVPEVTIISNIVEKGEPLGALGNDEVHFHADLVFLHTPGSVSILYCVETPMQGGDTMWSSGYAAYDALDEAVKTRIAELKCVYVHRNPAYNPPVPAVHPLVCTHPESRRKSLFLSPSSAHAMKGMDADAGRNLLNELYVHAVQHRFVWRHQWRAGDLIMWDNRCTMHRREAFANDSRRLMWRTQILGALSL